MAAGMAAVPHRRYLVAPRSTSVQPEPKAGWCCQGCPAQKFLK
jgi:hypothetical protein